MQTFQFVIDACAELLEKTRAKWDRATFFCSEHLKHSRKYMQNILSTTASPKKMWKLERNRDPTFYHHHEVKIPRAYACKTLTQDLLDGKLCEILKKNHRKSKGGRRAKKVPKTRDMCRKCSECDTCRRNATQASECNMCRESGVWVLRMRYMSKKRYLGAQNATPVDKMGSRCSECDTCRRNAI